VTIHKPAQRGFFFLFLPTLFRLSSVLLVSVLLGLGVAGASAAEPPGSKFSTGPEVGTKIPSFEATDQEGRRQTFQSLSGPNGLLLLFTRSADWCGFCKGHLVQFQRQKEAFEAKGVKMAALTYDSVEVLKHFAARAGITYPLLSDPDSEVIRAFGILNETISSKHPFFGIPNPGQYLIGKDGVVKAKFFEEAYSERYTAGNVLTRELGGGSQGLRIEKRTRHLRLLTSASDEIVRGGNRIALVVDVELNEKMHVYAPGVEGYHPIQWSFEPDDALTFYSPKYPEAKLLHLPAIQEIVPVYEGSFRLVAEVRFAAKPEDLQHLENEQGELVIKGSFRYQACDDKVCYLPETVPLEWKVRLEAHDRTRVPEELRRKTSPR